MTGRTYLLDGNNLFGLEIDSLVHSAEATGPKFL